MKTKQIMKELKTIRDLIYRGNGEQSQALLEASEKQEADIAYVAMMADVELEEEDETDE